MVRKSRSSDRALKPTSAPCGALGPCSESQERKASIKRKVPTEPKGVPRGLKLDPLPPGRPDIAAHVPRLRVAILNAFASRVVPHPAAVCCRVALTSSWFYSQAVARFVCCQPIRLDGPWLSMLPPVKVELLQVEDILAGRLHRPHGGLGYDVLLVPGGSAKADLLALRPEGCAQVRRFVQSGGGYCGICAGAFLAQKIRLVDVTRRSRRPEKKQFWDSDSESGEDVDSKSGREAFMVRLKFTPKGRKLLWHEGRSKCVEADEISSHEVSMRYHNGPLFDIPKASAAHLLGRMSREDKSLLRGAAGLVMQNFGGGRVVTVSPHPESTQDGSLLPEPGKERLRRVLQRAVLLAASGPAAHSWLEHECHIPAYH